MTDLDSSDEEGYTRVYSGSEDEDEEDMGYGPKYDGGMLPSGPEGWLYALRRGISVSNCIFLYWEDAERQIDGDAVYERFTRFGDAVEYVVGAAGGGGGVPDKVPAPPPPGGGISRDRPAGDSVGAAATGGVAAELGITEDETGRAVGAAGRRGDAKSPNKHDMKWDAMYEELKAWKEEHGGTFVPGGKSSNKLSRWAAEQRRNYRSFLEGKPTPMTQQRVDRLKELDFDFDGSSRPTKAKGSGRPGGSSEAMKWDSNFEKLKRYKEEHDTCDIPSTDKILGNWISKQRRQYKLFQEGKPSSMTEERLMKLTNVGLPMIGKRGNRRGSARMQSDPDWDDMFEVLRQYKEQNGTCQVPARPWTSLRGWVSLQIREYRKIAAKKPSALSAERIQRLNDLGFNFNIKKYLTWDERLAELKSFKAEHGHCVVPRHVTGLGKWVAVQRTKYKLLNEGKPTDLTHDRAKVLTDLGMVWQIFKMPEHRAPRKSWEQRYEELLAFKREFGHTIVPQHYPELGNWVHQQRTEWKLMKQGQKCLMTPAKMLKLVEIGFVFEVKPRKKERADGNERKVPSLQHAAARAATLQQRVTDQEEYVQQQQNQEAESYEMMMRQQQEIEAERLGFLARQQQYRRHCF